jgi:DNA-binding LacI/PurR family transcriptional regulator
VIHGVTRGLREAGIDLLYVVVDDDAVARLARLPVARASRSDGLVILGPAFPEASIRDVVVGGRPVVLVDNCLAETPVAAVMADNRPASEALTTHLVVDHGYERIACFAGPPSWPSTAERVAGYRAALATHGLPERIVHAPETTLRDGAALAERVADDLPDAIVAINDAMAIGALQRLRARPDRPAIVGFDDIGWARLTDPPLTTVAVDAELMGARAAWLLVGQVDRADSPPPAVVRIPATLRLRGSCGCPAATEDDQ